MASHVSIVDTSFTRHTVKVTPATFMTQVRDEACKKLKTNNYDLKYKNKIVDLSQTFRQTGLPSGATLELVVASRSAGVVSVALQFPNGTRSVDKFPSDTTLWRILRKFESTEDKNINITARSHAQVENGGSGAGRIFYEMPNVNIVGRECSSFGDLQKTLQQLGINNGTALMKLGYKKTDQPLEEAMAQIGEYFREEAATEDRDVSKIANASDTESGNRTLATENLSASDLLNHQANDTTIDTQGSSKAILEEETHQEPTADVTSPITPSNARAHVLLEPVSGPSNQHGIKVYLPPSSSTPRAAQISHNEEDFTPSLSQLKSVQGRLQTSAQNTRLLSDAEQKRQEEEKMAKLSAVKQLTIKIKFPDQFEINIETLFSTDSSAKLYETIKSVIAAEDQPFKLCKSGNGGSLITVPHDEKKQLVKDLGFSLREKVTFTWADGVSEKTKKSPTLKLAILNKAKERADDVVMTEANETDSGTNVPLTTTSKEPGRSGKAGGKVPSWLKLGKK